MHDTERSRDAGSTVTTRLRGPKNGVHLNHPRIWRRFFSPLPKLTYLREWTLTIQAARNLLADMREVFRCVEPSDRNGGAYGHRIRDLLMLACMEVESGCKSVLVANNYQSPQGPDRMNTADYVQLLRPMRLDEWEIALTMHPAFGSFKPFEGWDAAHPTQSLFWYDQYNAVKHDREGDFDKATVRAMVFAMGAVFVLACAQFGPWVRDDDPQDEDRVRVSQVPWTDEFTMLARPNWALEECYVPPSFQESTTWTPRLFWL